MATLEGFADSRSRFGGAATYGTCLLAADFLIKQRGVEPVLSYFTLFSQNDDRLGNFKTAFGRDLALFEKDFQASLQ